MYYLFIYKNATYFLLQHSLVLLVTESTTHFHTYNYLSPSYTTPYNNMSYISAIAHIQIVSDQVEVAQLQLFI